MQESACFRKVAMASAVANLPAMDLSCFTFLKQFPFEERNFSGENSTLVYLYLKSSASLFTTNFF